MSTIRVAYDTLGDSGSWVVFTHGLGDNRRFWQEIAKPIAEHHRLLLWDLRGAGQSDKPKGPYSPELFAADLKALLDSLGASKAHLVGYSAGGVISQRFALDSPSRVASLTLISTSSEVGEEASRAWQKLANKIEKLGFPTASSRPDRSFSTTFAQAHPEVVARAQARTLANDPQAYAASARAMSSYNWTSELGRINAPAIILQGSKDRLTPPGGSWILKRGLPRARLLIIPQAGHNLPTERPDLVKTVLLGFLAGVELSVNP